MHQMGLKQVTCTKSESGRAHLRREEDRQDRSEENECPCGKDHPVNSRGPPLGKAKLTRTSAHDSNIERPNSASDPIREVCRNRWEMAYQVEPCDANAAAVDAEPECSFLRTVEEEESEKEEAGCANDEIAGIGGHEIPEIIAAISLDDAPE
jgi:hypothetical protein